MPNDDLRRVAAGGDERRAGQAFDHPHLVADIAQVDLGEEGIHGRLGGIAVRLLRAHGVVVGGDERPVRGRREHPRMDDHELGALVARFGRCPFEGAPAVVTAVDPYNDAFHDPLLRKCC